MSSFPQMRSAPLPPPRLPERYRLRRHIATGGMAAVWCADDLVLDRRVAIKILAERFTHDQIAVRRFKREARAAARVCAHAHVVTVYDVGDVEPAHPHHADARAFLVMEFLAGGTVADAIRVGAVRRHESMRWLAEAASALDHAHAHGIVHRDIKPANFLLDRSRVLYVADFGIARMVSEETITSADQLFGTAAYLSPEQALGRAATSASDRYALAVAAFELLAGERPFTAPHFAAQARQHIEDEPPLASARDRSLPPAADMVLQRGMAKEPSARFATAGEFVGALRTALTESPAAPRVAARVDGRGRLPPARRTVAPRRTAAPLRAPRSRRHHHGRRAIALTALLVAVAAVVVVGLAARSGSARHPAPAAARRGSRVPAASAARRRPTAPAASAHRLLASPARNAHPVLGPRLTIPGQTAAVRHRRNRALRAAGQDPAPATTTPAPTATATTSATTSTNTPAQPPGRGAPRAPPTGGAGLTPPAQVAKPAGPRRASSSSRASRAASTASTA